MKAILLASTAALLALSACSKPQEPDTDVAGSISANEVAEKMNSVKLEPGEWEATQEILDVDVTGLPEGVPPEAMTRMIGQRTSYKHCVTPEQAANPSADFLSAQKDADCAYGDMAMADGKVKAEMSCAVPQQQEGRMKIAMNGTYLPDSYDMDMDVTAAGLPNGIGMTMKMKSIGKRIGDCPAGADAADNAAG